MCVCVGFRQQNSLSVNLAVNCAVNNGRCDQMCQPGSRAAGTMDRCACRTGFTLDQSGHKCLGLYRLTAAGSPFAIIAQSLMGAAQCAIDTHCLSLSDSLTLCLSLSLFLIAACL